MTSWYGKTTSKELEALIDRKAKLSELLLFPQFISELKAYNTKLLDYITNNPNLMSQAVQLITVAPSQLDSDQRKFKLPLMTLEMIESETTCVLLAILKESPNSQTYFQNFFKLLDNIEILPLLAGYLSRICACLLKNRQRQTLEKIYSSPHIFSKLIDHSYHMSITQTIKLFLNLDINKIQNNSENQSRLKVKLNVLQQILSKIQAQSGLRNQKSTMIIQNLCGIICDAIQRYYLLIHGKQLIEVITSDKTISLFMSLIKSPFFSENAFPAFNFFISLINYYSFSSFNVDQLNTEQGKKNLQRLQNQPMIIQLTSYFSSALDRIMRSPTMNLYLYRMLQVLCHCISISSMKIFECTRKTQFFNNLVKLMFNHQKFNILHVLIEKSFLHIFISQRKIYQQYKKHLFCEIDIIDSTAGHFMRQFPLQKLFQQGKKKAYFGHFMRILKIYSGIQTQDQNIIQAIKSKSQLWNKISKHLIIPYQNIYEKKLGTYQHVPQPVHQEFKVDKNLKIKTNPMKNSTIQQINKQQNVPLTGIKSQIQSDMYTKMSQMEQKKAQQMFYRTPIQGFLLHNDIISTSSNSSIVSSATTKPPLPVRPHNHMSQSNVVDYETTNSKQLKKSQSYKQFMLKQKQKAQKQIKLKRSISQQKRLSGNKAKIASPSPARKINSWKQDSTDQMNKTQQQPKTQKVVPKIPLSNTNRIGQGNGSISQRLHTSSVTPSTYINTSTVSATSYRDRDHNETLDESKLNYSINNPSSLVEIKKIRVFQIEKPAQKKYRKVEERDKVLFDFLGLSF